MTKTYHVRLQLSERQIYAAALAVGVFAVFSNCLSGLFLWDDADFVTRNVSLASWSGLPGLFTRNVVGNASALCDLYRPLQSLTHFIDLRLWGPAPWGHHLTNVLWHAAAAAAVFYWLAEFAAPPAAAAAAALYALHPLQSEAVAYVSGRGDTMAIFFVCLGLTLSSSRPRAALACAAAAVLSKESAVMFPVFLLLHDGAKGLRTPWRRHAPFWLLAAAYAGLRLTILDFHDTLNFYGAPTDFSRHFAHRLCTYLTTLPEGLRLWLWPSDLHHQRSWTVFVSPASPRVWLSAAALAAWLSFAAWRRRANPPLAAGLVWFAAATLPTSNLLVIINALFYDHWFLLPGLGLALVLARALPERGPARNAALGLCAALGLACIPLTRRMNAVWKTPLSLYSYILRYEPRSAAIRENLGNALADQGDAPGAIAQFRSALALSDSYPATHHDLGLVYEQVGRLKDAAAEYRAAAAMSPVFWQARTSLGTLALKQGRPREAQKEFAAALRIYPSAVPAYLGLAQARLNQGDREGARATLEAGLKNAPSSELRDALGRLDSRP